MTDKSKHSDMSSELYIKPEPEPEFWIPPKSKEAYIEDISTSTDILERIMAFYSLVELAHYRGQSQGWHYSDFDREEIIALIEEHIKEPILKELLAWMALKEG